MQKKLSVTTMWALVLIVSAPLSAQKKSLIVGTKQVEPFAMKDDAGNWTGISVELWQGIAEEMGWEYDWRELELDALLAGVQDGSLDAAVAALTINAEREQLVDFSHPYFLTGLGIVVPAQQENSGLAFVRSLFSPELLKVLLLLAFVLFLVGFVVWLLERGKNPEQFGGSALSGLASGFWWSAVTMTTVGYGDKAPATLAGRMVGLIWMFAGIIMISSFTAAITTELTVSQLETGVRGPEDLPRVRVSTVVGSTSEVYLRARRIAASGFESVAECIAAVADGQADAAVYDAPILKYLVNSQFRDKVRVLPQTFQPQFYGIALPERSPLREQFNRVMLRKTSTSAWQDVLFGYLGE